MIKVINLNLKRISVTLIIVGLMLILIGFGRYIDGRLKNAALMQNNINSLNEFLILDNTYSYKLPKTWITNLKNFNSNEIIYHNEFISHDNTIYGFVQIWNIKSSLLEFLKSSKEISEEQNIINNYSLSMVQINEKKAYLVSYALTNSKNSTYYAFEYFIPINDGFIRFSFFVNKEKYKENMPEIFETIVKTLKLRI